MIRLRKSGGSQIAEFAVTLPLLTVFAVGTFDFSGAFNLKQKLGTAAQEGAVAAASAPTYDLYQATPPSIQAAELAVFVSLENQNVLPNAVLGTGGCGSVPPPAKSNLTWTYTISGCPGTLTITINRGYVFPAVGSTEQVIGTQVLVSYPYIWRFNNVIQLISPGASFSLGTLSATATTSNLL